MPLTLNIQSAASFTTPDGGTESVGPISVVGAAVPVRTFATITSAGVTVAVPTGAWVGCIIAPPVTNTYALTARTTVGDTGVNIPPASPTVLLFDPANLPANLYLRSGTNTVGITTLLFF